MSRGKAGLSVVLEEDTPVLVISRDAGENLIDIYASGELVAALRFR